jgi:quercetin dioxygenase-like cupin family protein
MSSVITEAERAGRPGPFQTVFGPNDGATRIFLVHATLDPPDGTIGLHHHGGDEIWRVRRGRIRITVQGQHRECGAGQLVVVPPNVSHGLVVLDDDTEVEVIGEIAMGEWIAVMDATGTSRVVEVHLPDVPWHRPPPDGTAPTSTEDFLAMLATTHHLL